MKHFQIFSRILIFVWFINSVNSFQTNLEKLSRDRYELKSYSKPDSLVELSKKSEEKFGQQNFARDGKSKLYLKHSVATKNLEYYHKRKGTRTKLASKFLEILSDFTPGQAVSPFSILTIGSEGKLSTLSYPGPVINQSTPVLIHGFHPASGFLQCLWNCSSSLEGLFLIRSPRNVTSYYTHYIFLSHNDDAYSDAMWMRNRIINVGNELLKSGKYVKLKCVDGNNGESVFKELILYGIPFCFQNYTRCTKQCVVNSTLWCSIFTRSW